MEPAESKLIMITGCNKGVGFGILENLAKSKPGYKFLMAVRSVPKGMEALAELKKDLHNFGDIAMVKELDISKSHSIDSFVNWVQASGTKIDCLINNAGVASWSLKFDPKVINEILRTNVYGTIELTEKMLPLMPDNSKIVNISTELGLFASLHDEEMQKRLQNQTLTKEDIYTIAQEYHDKFEAHTPAITQYPFPKSADPVHSFSKMLINAYTRVLASRPDVQKKGIQVYACSPGWVKTDIGGPMAELTVQEGAICPTNVVNLPWKLDESIQGKFFSNSTVIPF